MWLVASPLVVVAGIGEAWQYGHDHNSDFDDVSLAPEVTVGYRVREYDEWLDEDGRPGMVGRPGLVLGVRGSTARFGHEASWWGNTTGHTEKFELTTVDLGVVAQIQLGRLWLEPWVGRHYTYGHEEIVDYDGCIYMCSTGATHMGDAHRGPLTAWGLLIELDVLVAGSHRLGVYVSFQDSKPESFAYGVPINDYAATTLGISYRH